MKDYDLIMSEFIKKQGEWRLEQILLEKLEILFPSPESHFQPDPIDEILKKWKKNKRK